MLMSHFEEPKLSDDEEPPTEQDKRKKMVRLSHAHAPMHTHTLNLESTEGWLILLFYYTMQ